MKIGICAPVGEIKNFEAIGFDYIEPSVVSIADLSNEDFSACKKLVDNSSIECEAFNVLFPGNFKLTGCEVNYDSINNYLINAFSRIALLGAKVVVFGSGAARKISENWSYESGYEQLSEVTKLVSSIAQNHDLKIAFEPLNKSETNTINNVPEAIKFISLTEMDNLGIVADFYHMRLEKESMNTLSNAPSKLFHAHIANSEGRTYPKQTDEDDYVNFFLNLKKIKYSGRISIEAKTTDIQKDSANSLKLLRTLAQ